MTYRTTRQLYQTVFPAKAAADPNFRTSMWMLPGEMDVTLSLEGWHASYRRAVAFQNPKLIWIRRGSVATIQRGKLVMRSEGEIFFIRRGESIGILPVNDQRFRMVTMDVTDKLVASIAGEIGRQPSDIFAELSLIASLPGQSKNMNALTTGCRPIIQLPKASYRLSKRNVRLGSIFASSSRILVIPAAISLPFSKMICGPHRNSFC